jgi:hypothetical protein
MPALWGGHNKRMNPTRGKRLSYERRARSRVIRGVMPPGAPSRYSERFVPALGGGHNKPMHPTPRKRLSHAR